MRYGSLFTGAGGLDLAVGMLWPNAELAWWSEVDEPAAASFARHTGAPNLGDVTAIDWTAVEPVDVLIGGFPCQDLSVAGARAGLSGDRSGLWFHMLDAMNALQPRLALLENVAGIYTATGDDDDVDVDRDVLDGRAARPARALDVVLGTLADNGFDAEWADYRASDVGAPHQRRRWFCAAYPHGQGPQGWDTGGVRERAGERSTGAGRPPSDVTLLATPQARDHKGVPGDGFNIKSLPRDVSLLPTPRPDRWGDYAPAIARWEAVIGRPAPAPTDEQGRLSPGFVEWMLGWPDGWTVGSRAQRLKQCGNGVVPLQAAEAYRQLLERL